MTESIDFRSRQEIIDLVYETVNVNIDPAIKFAVLGFAAWLLKVDPDQLNDPRVVQYSQKLKKETRLAPNSKLYELQLNMLKMMHDLPINEENTNAFKEFLTSHDEMTLLVKKQDNFKPQMESLIDGLGKVALHLMRTNDIDELVLTNKQMEKYKNVDWQLNGPRNENEAWHFTVEPAN